MLLLEVTYIALSAFITALYNASYSSAQSIKDFYPPFWGGGYQLLNANNGYGEPLNIIISSQSDARVLEEEGFLMWAKSLGFSKECLGLHGGGAFSANLGDGRGWVNQTLEVRQDYSSAAIGTCLETFVGGNHFRIFPQVTGAIFLAASKEEDLSNGHTPVPNGYDLGRDEIVAAAINSSSYEGVTFNATVEDINGLLNAGTVMNGSVGINHNIAIDGVVKLLTINVVSVEN